MLSKNELLMSVVNNPQDEGHYKALCEKTETSAALSKQEAEFATTLGYRVGDKILSRLFNLHGQHPGIARALIAGVKEEATKTAQKFEKPEGFSPHIAWPKMPDEIRDRLNAKAGVAESFRWAEDARAKNPAAVTPATQPAAKKAACG